MGLGEVASLLIILGSSGLVPIETVSVSSNVASGHVPWASLSVAYLCRFLDLLITKKVSFMFSASFCPSSAETPDLTVNFGTFMKRPKAINSMV